MANKNVKPEKPLTHEEKLEQELADKIKPLLEERLALELKRGNGISLEKSHIIGDREREIEKELSQLKTPKKDEQ